MKHRGRSVSFISVLACLILLTIALFSEYTLPHLSAQTGSEATNQQQTIQAAVNQLFTQTAQAQPVVNTQTIAAAFDQALTATAAFGTTATLSPAVSRYANIPTGITTIGPASGNAGAYPAPFPYLGAPNAPVKMEEIGSFSCPICMAYHQQVFVPLLLDEIRAGRVQFIFLPTTLTGDFDAAPATKAAYCAMQQGKFWPMYDLLFDGQSRLGANAAQRSNIQAFAAQAGVDTDHFNTCYTSSEATHYVQTTNNFANERGLLGTPTIFIFVNGQQVTPSQNNPNETPGSMAGLSLADLRQLIESGQSPSIATSAPIPTSSPIAVDSATPTLDPAAFDFSTAKLFKSDQDILEIQLPSGWNTTTQPPDNGQYSYAFTYGGTGLQDAPLLLQIQVSDAKSLYANIDQSGKADSPATALQALIDANSTPQPGSPTITFSKVQPVQIGTLSGQGTTATLPASGQNPEERYDIRLAQLPANQAVYVLVRGDASAWDKGQPIIEKMLHTLVIKTQHIPTPTVTPTLSPLLLTATAIQAQINALTPSVTPTGTAAAR